MHSLIYKTSLAVAMFAGLLLSSTSVQASEDFDLTISHSEPILQFAGTQYEAMVFKSEMWDDSRTRMVKRNRPFIELSNTSTSNIAITQFRIDIDELKYVYEFEDDILGGYAVEGASTSIGLSSSPVHTTDINGQSRVSAIDVVFPNGLQVGETIRFQVDIDMVDAYLTPTTSLWPDYRMVFFDINGGSNADNSDVAVTFASGLTSTQTLPDFQTIDPVFIGVDRSHEDMDPVDQFQLVDQIPEPSAAALAMLGLLMAGGRRRKS